MLQDYLSNPLCAEAVFVLVCILLTFFILLVLECVDPQTAKAGTPAETPEASSNGKQQQQQQQKRKKTITSSRKTVKSNVSGALRKKKATASGPSSRKSVKTAVLSQLMKLPPKSVVISSSSDTIKTGCSGGLKSTIKEGGVLSTGSYATVEPRKTEKLDGQLDSVIPAPDEDLQQYTA